MEKFGASLSQYWCVIIDGLNNNVKFEFDYDVLKEIYHIEMDYYNYVINHLNNDTYNSDKVLKTLKKLRELYFKMLVLTKLDLHKNCIKYVDQEIENWFKTDFHDGNFNPITKQIQLLNYIYGRKQCEFAHELVQQANAHLKNEQGYNGLIYSWITYAKSYVGGFYGKNAFEIMFILYENQKNDLITRLKESTVHEVQPCNEAHTMWIESIFY
ncbi:hypothetical protein QLL95_gp1263 [Cotonvirus japonicus]|uniref:Uncharacterized protein n=1 Tax=Cotonvirus japonicus TaxID=2811091 RepID=A0ABM7NRS8_9VIRU|nr:hypothetical protein QLL95_gp1263 [Cotonvirus japonicus]BCS82860.1 hypothetical protein [Cotonvirus japonicus]